MLPTNYSMKIIIQQSVQTNSTLVVFTNVHNKVEFQLF